MYSFIDIKPTTEVGHSLKDLCETMSKRYKDHMTAPEFNSPTAPSSEERKMAGVFLEYRDQDLVKPLTDIVSGEDEKSIEIRRLVAEAVAREQQEMSDFKANGKATRHSELTEEQELASCFVQGFERTDIIDYFFKTLSQCAQTVSSLPEALAKLFPALESNQIDSLVEAESSCSGKENGETKGPLALLVGFLQEKGGLPADLKETFDACRNNFANLKTLLGVRDGRRTVS